MLHKFSAPPLPPHPGRGIIRGSTVFPAVARFRTRDQIIFPLLSRVSERVTNNLAFLSQSSEFVTFF
jgi:hypothetical protein